jgi:hypothetical protein
VSIDYRNDPSAGGSYIPGNAGHDTYDTAFVEPELIADPFPDRGVQFTDFQGTSSPDGFGNPVLPGYSPSIDDALAFERQVTGEPPPL